MVFTGFLGHTDSLMVEQTQIQDASGTDFQLCSKLKYHNVTSPILFSKAPAYQPYILCVKCWLPSLSRSDDLNKLLEDDLQHLMDMTCATLCLLLVLYGIFCSYSTEQHSKNYTKYE